MRKGQPSARRTTSLGVSCSRILLMRTAWSGYIRHASRSNPLECSAALELPAHLVAVVNAGGGLAVAKGPGGGGGLDLAQALVHLVPGVVLLVPGVGIDGVHLPRGGRW